MKKHLKCLSVILAISIIFTLFSGFTNSSTFGNDLSVSQESIENIDNESISEPFVIEETTVEYLEADAFPAVLEKSEIQEKQYVGRVKVEEKNEYTLVLKNADGSNTLRLFDYPVKYTDETGVEKDITLKLTETAKGGYRTADNKIITTFSQKLSDGISLEYEDISIQMVPEEQGLSLTPITPITPAVPAASIESKQITPIKPIREASLSEDNEMVSYPFGNKTTLEYTLTYTGFKEDIVVEEYTGQTEYAFRLYTNGLTLVEEDGSYYLANENNEIKATIGDIIIFTADERNNTFGSMTYETITANEEYLMTIHVDADYLKDEKTVYPIRIDPTIEISYENNGAGAIQDVTLNSLQGSSGTSGSIMVGKRETYGISRVLMRFPNLSLSNIASASQITSASVEIRDIMCESTAMTVYCYPFTGNSWTDSTANWSNVSPNSYSTSASASKSISYANGVNLSPAHRYSFNITAIVKGWKSGTYTQSKGIIFKASSSVENGSTYISKTFASYNRSSNQPSLTITYTPQIELSATSVALTAGQTYHLTATTNPTMAITWTTNNSAVATVSSTGVVTGVALGSAGIKATCTDAEGNTYSKTCVVRVVIPNGVYRIKSKYNNRYLQVEGNGITNETDIVLESVRTSYPNYLSQLWKICYIESGYYSIRPLHKVNLGLYASMGGDVYLWDIGLADEVMSVTPYARWSIEGYEGNYIIKREGQSSAMLAVELPQTGNGTVVVEPSQENDLGQRWCLEDAPTSLPNQGTIFYEYETGNLTDEVTRYIAPEESLTLEDLGLAVSSYNKQNIRLSTYWMPYNQNIATVNASTGSITGVSGGSTQIKASVLNSGQSPATIYLNVTDIANGTYFIQNIGTSKHVDIENQNAQLGAKIHQVTPSANNTQRWIFTRIENEYYSITSESNKDLYLGVENNSQQQDASIILREEVDDDIEDGMKWKIEVDADSSCIITSKSGDAVNLVMAVESGFLGIGAGTVIKQRLYEDDNDSKDEWVLIKYFGELSCWYDEETKWIGSWKYSPTIHQEKLNDDINFSFNEAMASARLQWNNALNLSMSFTSQEDNADIKVYGGTPTEIWEETGRQMEINELGKTRYQIAAAGYYIYNNELKIAAKTTSHEVAIVSYSNERTGTQYIKTTTHELGHCLGFVGHIVTQTAIMKQGTIDIYLLTEYDIEHLQQVYE